MSEVISVSRVVAIFFVIYAHAYFGEFSKLELGTEYSIIDMFRYFFKEGLAEVSVPILSIISGYLCWYSSTAKPYRQVVMKKFETLILPMVFWSLLTVLLYLFLGLASQDVNFISQHIPSSFRGWVNAFLGVWAAPFNGPLHFLRDVFVCFLLAPAVAWLMVKLPVSVVVFSLVNYMFKGGVFFYLEVATIPVFLRPEIFCLFVIGYWIAMNRAMDDLAEFIKIAPALILVCSLMLPLIVMGQAWFQDMLSEWQATILHQAQRIIGVIFTFATALCLVKYGLYGFVRSMEKFAFVAFCSHIPITYVFAQLVGALTSWESKSPVWHVAFFLSPVICFLLSALLVISLQKFYPSLACFLTAGRVGRRLRLESHINLSHKLP